MTDLFKISRSGTGKAEIVPNTGISGKDLAGINAPGSTIFPKNGKSATESASAAKSCPTPAAQAGGRLPKFRGETFDPARDGERLGTQLERVFDLMRDGQWRTLEEIANAVHAPTPSVSARLRDLTRPEFGSHTKEDRYVGNGLWIYRIIVRQK